MANSLQFGPNPLLAAIQRPAPAATVNAAGAAPLPSVPTGQSAVPVAPPAAAALGFQPNSMDELLLARANREQPIDTGINLLGRLAALGVGRKIQRENKEGQQKQLDSVISSMPPELQSAMKIAAITDPSSIPRLLQQHASLTATATENQKDRSLTAEQGALNRAARSEENEADRALHQQQIDQQATQFAQKMGHEVASLEIDRKMAASTMQTNEGKLALQREEFNHQKDMDAAALAGDELDLSGDERKALGYLAQMSEPATVLNSKDFAQYIPTVLTENMLKQIAAFGDTSAAGFFKSYISSEFYQKMDDAEKRYFTNALGFAEAATRKASGATVTGADLAITFGRMINRAGDTADILKDKAKAREVEIESLLVGLPQAAINKLL